VAVARAEDRVEGTTRVGRQLITGHDEHVEVALHRIAAPEDEGTMEVDPHQVLLRRPVEADDEK
jgi:hypothetical protein